MGPDYDEDEFEDGPSAVELIPVLRLHLHEGLMALDRALTQSVARDIEDSIREGSRTTKPSPQTKELRKAYDSLIQYIGVDDDEPGYTVDPDGVVFPAE